MRAGVLVSIVGFSLSVASHTALSGQGRGAEELDRWEVAVDSGRVEGLREVIETWIATTEEKTPESLGRARFLRARLFSNVDSARLEYRRTRRPLHVRCVGMASSCSDGLGCR